MKDFEEKFPSLIDVVDSGYNYKNCDVVGINTIEKNCLDKQRVKEIIKKRVITLNPDEITCRCPSCTYELQLINDINMILEELELK